MSQSIILSGINCSTGSYLSPPAEVAELYRQIVGEQTGEVLAGSHYQNLRDREARQAITGKYNVAEGINPNQLDQAGWGVIFPRDAPAEVREALQPLLDHRRQEVNDPEARTIKFFQVFEKQVGYAPDDDKESFLRRLRRGVGQPADPKLGVPYYLLLVGSPAEIPWDFQFDLDVEYAVGRICFVNNDGSPDVAAYRRYAESVVRAETGPAVRQRAAAFFAPRHDPATEYSADRLVKPLLESLSARPTLSKWDWTSHVAAQADKAQLDQSLHHPSLAFLFTAGHGGFFNADDPLADQQGALLCQGAGSQVGSGSIASSAYFSHRDVRETADLSGLITFHFACYSLGTPSMTDYPNLRTEQFEAKLLRTIPEVSRLPMRLLSHSKGGALACVGHVDRAWSCSFLNSSMGSEIGTFSSCLERILRGNRLGWALEFFNERYASLAVQLTSALNRRRVRLAKETDAFQESLVATWLEHNDARNYAIFGDPAVRLRTT